MSWIAQSLMVLWILVVLGLGAFIVYGLQRVISHRSRSNGRHGRNRRSPKS